MTDRRCSTASNEKWKIGVVVAIMRQGTRVAQSLGLAGLGLLLWIAESCVVVVVAFEPFAFSTARRCPQSAALVALCAKEPNQPKIKGSAKLSVAPQHAKQQQRSRRPAFSQAAYVATPPLEARAAATEKHNQVSSDDTAAAAAAAHSIPLFLEDDTVKDGESSVPLVPVPRTLQSQRRKPGRADGTVMATNAWRVSTAGRVGTKRHVNPCKVYLGNLDFCVTAHDVREWVVSHMGLPSHVLLASSQNAVHVVTDWRSGRSKGYAFVVFTEPMYATVAMATLHGAMWHDRQVTASQGVAQESILHQRLLEEQYLAKQAKRQQEAAANQNVTSIPEPIYMEAHEATMLSRLDPDLLEGVTVLGQESLNDDDDEYDGDDDDDDDLEEYQEDDEFLDETSQIADIGPGENEAAVALNRVQRREAAKRAPRRKKPSQGFGR
jgi:RNA recognition motif. (a.k.a. RRM, RBD, or RNP domain)